MNTATDTIDPEELTRYNQLAEMWWDPDGPMAPLHKLNALRAPYIIQHVCRQLGLDEARPQPLAGVDMLDIGCGGGLLSEAMASAGANVTGIDPARRNIAIARTHAEAQGITIDYREGALEQLSLPTFDVVLNMEVVEHVEQLPAFMAMAGERCRPDGLQFVATINRNPLSFLVAIVGAEYVLRWLPKGTHQWRKFVTVAELEALLRDSGFHRFDEAGVAINPLTKRFRLTSFLGVNYMVAARRAR